MMLSPRDREAIERLVYDAALEPSYEAIKDCLVWEDERPRDVSREGYEFVSDLLIYRGIILHRGETFERLERAGLSGEAYVEAWTYATKTALRWPGMKRLVLSERDSAYLIRSRSAPL